jgi:hypothetical protein
MSADNKTEFLAAVAAALDKPPLKCFRCSRVFPFSASSVASNEDGSVFMTGWRYSTNEPGWIKLQVFVPRHVYSDLAFCPDCVLIFAANPFAHLPESFVKFVERRKQTLAEADSGRE